MYYKELEIQNFKKIQNVLVPHVLKVCKDYKNFWNHIDIDYILKVPLLASTIEQQLGQIPIKCYLGAIPDYDESKLNKKLNSNSLHRDTSTETYRLNWPIFNSDSIETKFFKSDFIPTKLYLPTGETYLKYEIDQCEEVTSNILKVPTLINVKEIHGLYKIKNNFPRFILGFKFPNEIIC